MCNPAVLTQPGRGSVKKPPSPKKQKPTKSFFTFPLKNLLRNKTRRTLVQLKKTNNKIYKGLEKKE